MTKTGSCNVCIEHRRSHGLRGFSWPEIITYGVHLALEHKVKVQDDGTVMVTPNPEGT